MIELQPLAQARGVELRCFAEGESMVKADPVGLQTVWVNLLQNAVQHSPAGSAVCVKVAASEGNTAVVIVEDSGTGIPTEQLPHVFERFQRGDSSRARSTGGFGLGLTICKTIVEAYGGRIQIACPHGGGTRVSVSLPALAPVLSENSSPS